ncbi:MAG: hypothetical protein HY738_21445, partial [Bacteroidia bacterium]|nr:hypothetical protein [Bacteroidia bacterium]
TASISSQTNVLCNGGSNGQATATQSGGTGPFDYVWNDPAPAQSTATVTGLTAGTWIVTITDANLCTSTATVIITEPGVLSAVISSATNVSCNGASTGSATVAVAGGTSSYSYVWNDPAPAQSTATVTGLTVGTWTVTVTDANNCTTTATANITEPAALTTTITGTGALCNGNSDGTSTVTASGGTSPYTYLWDAAAGNQSTPTASGLGTGMYSVTVTDANSCTTTNSYTVTEPLVLTATPSSTNSTCGASNGTASVSVTGGTGGYSYDWSPNGYTGDGTNIYSNLPSGSYTITVTDGNSCTEVQTIIVSNSDGPTASISSQTNVLCNGGSNGQATATQSGGTGPYSYVWNDPVPAQSTASVTGLTAGTWTVTVTDANLCTSTATVTITEPGALSAVISSATNVGCNGASTGSATVAVAGGTSSYNYVWNDPAPAQSTATVTGLTAGTWTVTVTDANNCTTTATANITQPVALTTTIAGTGALCNSNSDGTSTITPSGGTLPYTYLWDAAAGNQSTPTASGLGAGTYSVTVTDANSCTATNSYTVTEPSALTATPSSTNSTCGTSNGTASVSVSGGIGAYSYDWSPDGYTGDGTNTYSALPSGSYTITVTDGNSCTEVQTITVSNSDGPTANILSQTNVLCNGDTNGEATATQSGGTGTYSYVWNDPAPAQSAATVTGLTAGTWTVTVTDISSCTSTATVTITEPGVLSAVISSATNVSCNGASTGSATVAVAGGTSSYNYIWNDPAPAQSTATVTSLTAGTWTVTVTDANNCTTTATANITEPTVLTTTITGTDALCNGNSDGTSTITHSGGTSPYTYLWDAAADNQSTPTASGLGAGTYSVTVTDANGCTATNSYTIAEPVTLTATQSSTNSTCGSSNGTASINVSGGTTAYSYDWSPDGYTGDGTGTYSDLPSGSYTVSVTDANGCTIQQAITVFNSNGPTASIASQVNVSCNGGNDGQAMVSQTGGTSPVSYLWSGGAGTDSTATGLSVGTYTVTVSDAILCTSVASVTITEPVSLTAIISSSSNVSCNGGNDGSASVSASGGTSPYNYLWPGGITTDTITGLSQGSYTVTVTDNNNCTITATATIAEPTGLTTSTTETDVYCYNGSDGTATVSASGGTPSYSYQWDAGAGSQSTPTATGLSAGTYFVTVTDASGCSTIDSAIVGQPTQLSLSATGIDATGAGICDGQATATVNGGISPYTYLWSNGGQTTITATGLCAGIYTVTVTDDNGCTEVATVTILEPGSIIASITSIVNTTCNGYCDGSATVSVSGGIPPYIYLWSSGGTDSVAIGLCAGDYFVTVSDNNGYSSIATATIIQPTILSALITSTSDASCNGGNDGSATVLASGGTPAYSYLWPDGNTSTTDTGLGQGSYNVTVTDSQLCTTTATANINQPVVLTANINVQSNVSCQGGNNGSATVFVSGGTLPYSYLWDDPAPQQTDQLAINLSAGTYHVTVTDGNLCTTTDTVIINEPALLTSSTTSTDVSCYNGNDGQAVVLPAGGTLPYTVYWNTSDTTFIINGLSVGNYFVTVTDAQGCTTANSVIIGQPSNVSGTINTIDAHCGQPDGSAIVTAGGGTGPYTYLWNDPLSQTSATLSNVPAGIYEVTITDSYGCTAITTGNIGNQGGVVSSITTVNNITCYGLCNGSLTVSATGGTPPYQYFWNDPMTQTTATATGLCAGNYIVSVIDLNSCISISSDSVTEPAVLIANISETGNVSCFGGSDGYAVVQGTGGILPYTYTWNGGTTPTNDTTNNLMTGAYYVTITDFNGCSDIDTTVVVQPPPLAINMGSVNENCNQGNGIAFVMASGGTATVDYGYSWSGGTNPNTSAIANLSQNTYFVTVTDDNGCSITGSVIVGNIPAGVPSIASSSDISCFGLCDGQATLSYSGGPGPLVYSWNTIPAQTTATATNLCPGSYTVNITDGNNCITSTSVIINTPDSLSVTLSSMEPECYGGNNGSILASPTGGTIPYSYLWSSLQITQIASGLYSGIYSVTVTDSSNCQVVESIEIINPPAIMLSAVITNANCNQADGALNLTVENAALPVTYSWAGPGGFTSSNQNLNNVFAGNYSVTVIDFKNCQAVASWDINNESGPTTSIIDSLTISASCNGACDGTATVAVSGGTPPYTYLWNDAFLQVTPIANNLCTGTYSVAVMDSNGCVSISTVNITEPAELNILVIKTDPLCNNSCDGTVTALVTGGTIPYTYLWSGINATDQTVGSLCAGFYNVFVSDANNCQISGNTTLFEPPFISILTTVENTGCYNTCDGQITASPAGGTGTFTYYWNDPNTQQTQTASGLCAGTYYVTVTDGNGCTESTYTTVNSPQAVSAQITNYFNLSCYASCDGYAIVGASGGTGAYTYGWSNGSTETFMEDACAGQYAVTVTDENSCTATANISVTEPSALGIGLFIEDESCYQACDGEVTTIVTGGTLPYSYIWSNFQSDPVAIDLCAGNISVTVSDAHNCTIEADAVITGAPFLAVNLNSLIPSHCGQSDGSASVIINGGTPGFHYSWDDFNGQPISYSTFINNVPSGAYYFAVIDSNGCSANYVVNINDIDGPAIDSIAYSIPSCFGYINGTAQVYVSGGTPTYNYMWDDTLNQTTNIAIGLQSGTYTVIATDAAGCNVSGTITILQPANLMVAVVANIDASCNGSCDGMAIVQAGGGTQPYSFVWSNSDTGNQAQNLCAGSYSVTVTDANGCTKIKQSSIGEPAYISVFADITDVSCYGGSDGIINLSSTGGIGPYSYIWLTPPATQGPVAANLPANVYDVLVRDENNCEVAASFGVDQPEPVTIEYVATMTYCNGDNGLFIIFYCCRKHSASTALFN